MDLKQVQSFFESLATDSAERFVNHENITNEIKDDGTPVTSIDRDINAYVIREIETAFPGIPILSEEMGEVGDRFKSEYCFIVDPIDGTAALKESKGITDLGEFARFVDDNKLTMDNIDYEIVYNAGYSVDGVRALILTRGFHDGDEESAISEFAERITEYGVLLGLARDGRSVCGVCYVPAKGELYSASDGDGAFRVSPGAREEIHASGSDDGRVLVGRYNIDHDLVGILKQQGRTLKDVYFGGSFGVKVCRVAEGRFDRYIHTNMDPNKKVHASLWDPCAVDVILSEAGGHSCDLDGNRIDYKSESVPLTRGYIAMGSRKH